MAAFTAPRGGLEDLSVDGSMVSRKIAYKDVSQA